MTSAVIGIDPGNTGAIAVYNTSEDRVTHVFSIPTLSLKKGKKTRTRVDKTSLVAFAATLWQFWPEFVVIEQVSGLPGQSAPYAFTFGETCGAIETACIAAKLPLEFVAPAQWKRALGCAADKDYARLTASRLMPDSAHWWPLKGDHDKAEAALIALYGARFMRQRHAA